MTHERLLGAFRPPHVRWSRYSARARTPAHRSDSSARPISPMVNIDHASWRSDQAVLERKRTGRGPRGDTQLVEDIADMPRHGVLANGKVAGDLAVRLSASYQHQDFVLALGKQCLRTTGAFGRRVEGGRVGSRAKPLEHRPCGFEMSSCGIVVAELLAGPPNQHPNPLRLVGGLELLPGRP